MVDKKSEIVLSEFQDGNFRRLTELTKKTYPGREISDPEYLKWEYLENPDGKALIFVAAQEAACVSQYILLPRKFIVNGVQQSGSLSVNTLTDPAFRGKNLFPQLAEKTYDAAANRGIAFTVGFPNPLSSPVFNTKLRFHSFGRIPFYIKPLRPIHSALTYFFKKGKKRGEETPLAFDPYGRSKTSAVSLFELETDKNKFEEFIAQFHADKMCCTKRSFEFFKWRYCVVPMRTYQIYKVETENHIQAIAVVRSATLFGLKALIVVDLLNISSAPSIQAAENLLQWLTQQSAKRKMDLVAIARQDTGKGKISMGKLSFFRIPDSLLPQPLEFIFRTHSPNVKLDVATDIRQWYLSFGDGDIF
ncbi:MAG TPA: GNAT family N-acetyltransferase [Bacteroidia bacterium]|nr:GNAT family N-acetyltransferase [Bacteroidia bacterium]